MSWPFLANQYLFSFSQTTENTNKTRSSELAPPLYYKARTLLCDFVLCFRPSKEQGPGLRNGLVERKAERVTTTTTSDLLGSNLYTIATANYNK